MGGRRRKTHKQRRPRHTLKGGAVEPSFGVDSQLGPGNALWSGASTSGPYSSATGQAIPDPYSSQSGGRRRRGMSAKTLRRMLKKNGLKVSGKKSTLTKRAKKAKLMRGGAAAYLPSRAVAGFSGAGSRGLADYSDVSGGAPRANDVVPLRG